MFLFCDTYTDEIDPNYNYFEPTNYPYNDELTQTYNPDTTTDAYNDGAYIIC